MLNTKLFTAAVVAWGLLGPTAGLAANCKQDPNQPKCQDSTFTTMAFTTLPPTGGGDRAFPDLMTTDIEDPNDPGRDPDDQHVCPPEVTIEIDGTRGFGTRVGDCFADFTITDPNSGSPLDLATGSMQMQRNSFGEITQVSFIFRPRGGSPRDEHPTMPVEVATVRPSASGFDVIVEKTLTVYDGQGPSSSPSRQRRRGYYCVYTGELG